MSLVDSHLPALSLVDSPRESIEYFHEFISSQVMREITQHLSLIDRIIFSQAIWTRWTDCGAPAPYYMIGETVYLTPSYIMQSFCIQSNHVHEYIFKRNTTPYRIDKLFCDLYTLAWPDKSIGWDVTAKNQVLDTSFEVDRYRHFVNRLGGASKFDGYYTIAPGYLIAEEVMSGGQPETPKNISVGGYLIQLCNNSIAATNLLKYVRVNMVEAIWLREVFTRCVAYEVPAELLTGKLTDGSYLFDRPGRAKTLSLQGHRANVLAVVASGRFTGKIRLYPENDWVKILIAAKSQSIPVRIYRFGNKFPARIKADRFIDLRLQRDLTPEILAVMMNMLVGYIGSAAEVFSCVSTNDHDIRDEYVRLAREKYPDIPVESYCHDYEDYVRYDITPGALLGGCGKSLCPTWRELAVLSLRKNSINFFTWLMCLARDDPRLCVIQHSHKKSIYQDAAKHRDPRFLEAVIEYLGEQ